MTKDEATVMLGALQMLEVLIKPEDEVSIRAFTYVWNTIAQIANPINDLEIEDSHDNRL